MSRRPAPAGAADPGAPPLVLLGPRGSSPSLGEALRDLGSPSPVATVTAGWQEREGEDEELARELGGRTVNLRLYARAERVAAGDRELRDAHRRLQDALKLLRAAYNVRLAHLMDAWTALLHLHGDREVLEPEREAALAAIRNLDAEHLERVGEMRAAFERRWEPDARPAVQRERREVEEALDGAAAVVIAGGHVAVLLNRLRLFGLARRLAGRPVVAWSAGAMALASRVVLFHDSPPQGPGHAEAFDRGLGLYDDVVPLPHAARRLRTRDRERTLRFARRFAPTSCVLLDEGERIERRARRWLAPAGARRLDPAGGGVEPWP